MYPYIIQGDNITVVMDNEPHTINKSHLAYQRLLNAIKANDWDTVRDVIDPKQMVIDYGNGNISIQGDTLYWHGHELHNSLTRRMVEMIHQEFPVEPLANFMSNLMQNPSKQAVDELYGFLEHNTLPITPDGHFLAYKRVQGDYLDCHSRSVLNKPAVYLTDDDREQLAEYQETNPKVSVEVVDGVTRVSMARYMVDDRRENTCSTGLHFCSREYLEHFWGDRIVIVKINPADVVSIPVDYNNAKGRTCCYTVVDEIDKDNADKAFSKAVQDAADSEASTIKVQDLQRLAELIKEVMKDDNA